MSRQITVFNWWREGPVTQFYASEPLRISPFEAARQAVRVREALWDRLSEHFLECRCPDCLAIWACPRYDKGDF